jgi:ABC-type uncharacterized transport system substrate-binding protein
MRRMRRYLIAWILSFAGIVASAGVVTAHPHVWIDVVATFVFERGKLAGVRLEWTFDEFLSDTLVRTYDKDKDGTFDEKETQQIQAQAFSSLKDQNYFTHLSLGGKKIPIREVTDFSAMLRKGRLVYRFTVPLHPGVDPAKTPVALSVYDETYYVDVSFDRDDPVRFEGVPKLACRYEVREDAKNPIYFGMVLPLQATLDCKEAY